MKRWEPPDLLEPRRAHPNWGSVMSQTEALKGFMVVQSPNAELVKNWLKGIRRIFEGLDIQKK